MDAFEGSVSRIEFRQGSAPVPWDEARNYPTIEVLIDGVKLTSLWQEATKEERPALSALDAFADLAMWGPDWTNVHPDGTFRSVREGYSPVLTCSCTVFDCGGVCARITFTETMVIWEDFRPARPRVSAPPLGPFSFDRHQYEEARRAFLRHT